MTLWFERKFTVFECELDIKKVNKHKIKHTAQLFLNLTKYLKWKTYFPDDKTQLFFLLHASYTAVRLYSESVTIFSNVQKPRLEFKVLNKHSDGLYYIKMNLKVQKIKSTFLVLHKLQPQNFTKTSQENSIFMGFYCDAVKMGGRSLLPTNSDTPTKVKTSTHNFSQHGGKDPRAFVSTIQFPNVFGTSCEGAPWQVKRHRSRVGKNK